MISAEKFWKTMKGNGITFWSGVPCSLLGSIIDYAYKDPQITYIPAPREDAALGLASGAYLSGRAGGILIQNSGLGNIINALTSFNLIYKVPILMVISWRKDEPEHSIMGGKTTGLLDALGIGWHTLWEEADDPSYELEDCISRLRWIMEKEKVPIVLLLSKGDVE